MPINANDPTSDVVALMANIAGEMELGARRLTQQPVLLLCALAAIGFVATLAAKRPRRQRLRSR